MDAGWDQSGEWPCDRVGNLAFLSARPHIYKVNVLLLFPPTIWGLPLPEE